MDPATAKPSLRRDIYHQAVKNALSKEAWTITHDPLTVPFGIRKVYLDLGAERLLAAERGGERIAVEIKSFVGVSEVADLEAALGQFVLYRSLLVRYEPDRKLYLAVPSTAFEAILADDIGRAVREDTNVPIIIFDPRKEVVQKWLK